ncbi:MAG: 50S ribosomal protein L15 [bacterium]|nr:50S ribosomal protein L15 [bacterium]
MSLNLHTLRPAKGARTKSFRIGRGLGSGRGKTAGRGTKGQRSRSGGRSGLQLKGMKQMLLAFPKSRGFQSLYSKLTTVPLTRLDKFADNTKITLALLKKEHMVSRSSKGAKLVGVGPVTKKWIIDGLELSSGAKKAIESAGGSIAKKKKVVSAKKSDKKSAKKV